MCGLSEADPESDFFLEGLLLLIYTLKVLKDFVIIIISSLYKTIKEKNSRLHSWQF